MPHGEQTDSNVKRRYKVVEGSITAHCCFTHTVVDTSRSGPHRGGQPDDKDMHVMAECFERDDADSICSALNVMHHGR